MGYYSEDAWRAYIDKLGNFLFQKDANNYFSYDGINFTFRGPLIADDMSRHAKSLTVYFVWQ